MSALRRRDWRRAHGASGSFRVERAREERQAPDQDQGDEIDHIDLRWLGCPAPQAADAAIRIFVAHMLVVRELSGEGKAKTRAAVPLAAGIAHAPGIARPTPQG